MDQNLRNAIIAVYKRFTAPADRIVCDPALAAQFATEVNREHGIARGTHPIAEVSMSLLRLRKAGALSRKRKKPSSGTNLDSAHGSEE